MVNKKTVEVLNTLITINNDRIEGYHIASRETKEVELKSLFSKFISNSQNSRQDLVREVKMLGGQEAEGTRTSGKFFRVWMEMRSVLTGKGLTAILSSCAFGESQARDTYSNAIKYNFKHLSAQQCSMIMAQQELLKSDQDRVRALKNAW